MLNIIVDSRESRSEVIPMLQRRGDIAVEVRELSSGDYLPHPTFGVERKEATDFVLSIMDRRLFSQVLRLKDEYDSVLFVIEGNPYQTRSGIAPTAIMGAISYLMAIERVSLLNVADARETAELLATMARHLQEGLGYEIPLRHAKPKDYRDLAQYLVEGCPGIGATGAKALLAHFGSAQAVFEASVPELCAVSGVGKKTAERIKDALQAPYSA